MTFSWTLTLWLGDGTATEVKIPFTNGKEDYDRTKSGADAQGDTMAGKPEAWER
jgi:hypothetical protein